MLRKYGSDSASLIKFVNKLADKIKVWVKTKQPNREVKLCIFAYQPTKKPPVLFNEDGSLKRDANGKAIPVDHSVVLRDNVVVRLAPIEANWFVPFDEKENQWVADLFDGWSAIAKNITAYVYSNNFFSQYANLNNFDSLKANYQFLKKYNCKHVYDQFLTSGHLSPCFTNYRMFLQSNLLWDLSLDVDALTEEFFENYYKDAKEPMLKYFNELKEHYKNKWKKLGLNGECNYVFLYFQELWDKETLLKWLGYMDEAYNVIRKYYNQKQTSLYRKLYDRITMECCGLRFLYVTLYGLDDMNEKEMQEYAPGRYWLEEYKEGVTRAPRYLDETDVIGEELPIFAKDNLSISYLAATKDFKVYKKFGRITESNVDDRDVFLFPEKINGKYCMISRPKFKNAGVNMPSIWISFGNDIVEFEKPELLLTGEQWWEQQRIGGGTPPIKTDKGWFMLYHGVDEKGIYRVGAVLLDLNDPRKVICRTKDFLMEPDAEFELNGLYSGCVFPTGTVVKNGTLFIYYGCADMYIGLATCDFKELIDYLFSCCKL